MHTRPIFPYVFLALMLLGVTVILSALATGTLKGVVVDEATGQPVGGASVYVVGTNESTVTATDGSFTIGNLPADTYDLRISHIEFGTLEMTGIAVGRDSATEVVARMSKKDPGEESEMDDFSVPMKELMRFKAADMTAVKKGGGCPPNIGYIRLPQEPVGFPPAHGGTAIVNGEAFDAMFFKNYGVNPFVDTEDDHLSTFAIDVDDASYIMARSYLERGALPPDEAIRTEEFVNHFSYEYEPPKTDPFMVYCEGAPSKFGPNNSYLLRVGIKGRKVLPENRKPANLVFVIDVSGSMAREDRLGLVKKALRLLVDELTVNDRVGIVVYGSTGRVVLEPTSLVNKERIVAAIESLVPGGSTFAEEGIMMGYKMADRHFEKGRINRIILCSDGVANVGRTGADDILKQIKEYAEKGITLSSVGFGMGNYNDILLEKLGNKGNGYYAYVDNLPEARRIFVENLTGTLEVIARDVKIQVDFDPEVVRSYRLLGYENRDVEDNKFRDDTEDGGEIGSGHEVTALYEIKFHRQSESADAGTIFIRYKSPEGGQADEVKYSIERRMVRRSFESASAPFRLAAAAAEFGEILRNSYWAKGSDLGEVLSLANEVFSETGSKDVLELMNLISKADSFKQLAEK